MDWTRERIAQLPAQDVRQLRDNAERLKEPELVALCDQLLEDAPKSKSGGRGRTSPRTTARRLIARGKAFGARGVYLDDPGTSWGGVRKSDAMVVMALWADAIVSSDGGCSYRLWAPNVGGACPWSDKAGGRQRLEQCRRAMAAGKAEGLLVYGERLEGWQPEDKAYSVHGVDAETVLIFKVESRGGEFWAVWGKSVNSKGG